jgi:CBS domain-containing protein
MIPVHEVMSTAPVTVTPMTSLEDLLTLFDRHDYNAFPVLGQDGRLAGMVSKLDILRLFVTVDARSWSVEAGVCVADVMQRKVVSAGGEDDILDAGTLMIVTKRRSVPVVQAREPRPRLIGMLSRGDVLRGLRFQLERSKPQTSEAAA